MIHGLNEHFKWYYDNGYITSRDGNCAVRAPSHMVREMKSVNSSKWFYVTESGIKKDHMHDHGDCILVDQLGKNIDLRQGREGKKVSIETAAHLSVLNDHPRDNASVHVHSPNTVALAALYTNLSKYDGDSGYANDSSERFIDMLNSDWPELFRYTKVGPLVRFYEPGSLDLHTAILDSMRTSDICIMQRHGVLARGKDLDECKEHIVRLEHISTILLKIVTASGKLESIHRKDPK